MQHRLLALVVCASVSAGCASITGGESQAMRVTATNASGDEITGANCKVANDKGAWTLQTPGEIQVRRSNNAISVTCEKKPFPAGHASVPSLTRDAMYGNILFGGLIGVAIDHSSGSGYEYSPHVNVVMGKFITISAAPPLPSAKAAKLHDRPGDLPEPSGYADYRDITAVPSPKARAAYQEHLGKRQPRAFAIGDDGGFYSSWGRSDSVTRAVERCAERHRNCRLYSYDDVVVWRATDAPPAPGTVVETKDPATAVTAAGAADPPKPREHLFHPPRDTGFADPADPLAMPFVDSKARERYVARYRILKAPKAFAIGAQGQWQYLANDPRSMKTVLERCNASNKGACWLYAVDDQVVWSDEPGKRISIEKLVPR